MPQDLWITREGELVRDDGKMIRDFHQNRHVGQARLVDFVAELVEDGELTLQQIVDACEERRRVQGDFYRRAPVSLPAPSGAMYASCSDMHSDCTLRKIW
ncbi:MAG: hypothetical protein WA001_01020 [Patescibacteria group bacterium]